MFDDEENENEFVKIAEHTQIYMLLLLAQQNKLLLLCMLSKIRFYLIFPIYTKSGLFENRELVCMQNKENSTETTLHTAQNNLIA